MFICIIHGCPNVFIKSHDTAYLEAGPNFPGKRHGPPQKCPQCRYPPQAWGSSNILTSGQLATKSVTPATPLISIIHQNDSEFWKALYLGLNFIIEKINKTNKPLPKPNQSQPKGEMYRAWSGRVPDMNLPSASGTRRSPG